jgi:hypothetical protein
MLMNIFVLAFIRIITQEKMHLNYYVMVVQGTC